MGKNSGMLSAVARAERGNEMMPETGIRPFANGFEYDCWTEANCEECSRRRCTIKRAIEEAASTDGTICREMARRMGFDQSRITRLGWPCPEKIPKSESPSRQRNRRIIVGQGRFADIE